MNNMTGFCMVPDFMQQSMLHWLQYVCSMDEITNTNEVPTNVSSLNNNEKKKLYNPF